MKTVHDYRLVVSKDQIKSLLNADKLGGDFNNTDEVRIGFFNKEGEEIVVPINCKE